MGTSIPPPAVGPIVQGVLSDLRRSLAGLLVFAAVFTVVYGMLYVPFADWLVAAVVSLTGRAAITNLDILQLWCYLALLCSLVFIVVGQFLAHAGVMVVAVMTRAGEKLTVRRVLRAAVGGMVRMFRLGFLLVLANVLVFLPIVGLGGMTYLLLLTGHDINTYLTARPPAFWIAFGIGGVLIAVALVAAAFLYVRWIFALPILLFETRPPITALLESRNRVRGAGWRIGAFLLCWNALAALLSAAVLYLLHLGSDGLLALLSGISFLPAVVEILAALNGLAAAALAFLHFSVHALLILRLYEQRSAQEAIVLPDFLRNHEPVSEAVLRGRLAWWRGGVVCCGLGLLLWFALPALPAVTDGPVVVSGHRGYGKTESRPAAERVPENTVPAFLKAIECGADFGELDVQETRDGAIVLNHDNDLQRVAGVPRAVWDLDWDEIKALDVGRHAAPEYHGTRVPKLAEVIEAVRGKLKLNIEIKFDPARKRRRDYHFAERVADLITELHFEDQCIVTSLDDRGVMAAKKRNPKLRVGAIIGDVPRIDLPLVLGEEWKLPVDVLIVPKGRVTDGFLKAARLANKEVHVWGADTRAEMADLLDRGVHALIVDHPEVLKDLLRERAGLSKAERLRRAFRAWLADN
jgi:glycerophosphoryl diester phosphodiesterase